MSIYGSLGSEGNVLYPVLSSFVVVVVTRPSGSANMGRQVS